MLTLAATAYQTSVEGARVFNVLQHPVH